MIVRPFYPSNWLLLKDCVDSVNESSCLLSASVYNVCPHVLGYNELRKMTSPVFYLFPSTFIERTCFTLLFWDQVLLFQLFGGLGN